MDGGPELFACNVSKSAVEALMIHHQRRLVEFHKILFLGDMYRKRACSKVKERSDGGKARESKKKEF